MLDVTDADAIAAAAERVEAEPGGLDGLVDNAGDAVAGPLEALPIEDFRRQVELNLTAQLAVTQAMLPAIRTARGRVVMISSMGGRVALPLTGAYHAAKFGLEAVGDSLRQELAPWGIKVVLIEPGSIDTPIWTSGEEDADGSARPGGAADARALRRDDRALPQGRPGHRRARHPGRRRWRRRSSTRWRRGGRGRATWSGSTRR